MGRLNHDFSDPSLLDQAFVHRSLGKPRVESNERLEFLGDRVLGVVIAELLYHAFPKEPEGALGPRFTALARRETLAEIAEILELGPLMRLSPGEEDSGGRKNPALLADVCEAVLGALYLDGGLEAARSVIVAHWKPRLALDPTPPKDAKTRLQEWAQGTGRALPSYTVVKRDGPDHAPHFVVGVHVEGTQGATGEGASKRVAEQAAAAVLMEQLGL